MKHLPPFVFYGYNRVSSVHEFTTDYGQSETASDTNLSRAFDLMGRAIIADISKCLSLADIQLRFAPDHADKLDVPIRKACFTLLTAREFQDCNYLFNGSQILSSPQFTPYLRNMINNKLRAISGENPSFWVELRHNNTFEQGLPPYFIRIVKNRPSISSAFDDLETASSAANSGFEDVE